MATEAENDGGPRVGRWRVAGWSLAALLLLMPLIAMRITDEVRWTGSDFVFAAVLIGGVGGMFELAVRMSRDVAYRAGAALALAAAFLMTWISAAVGIVGDQRYPWDLLYAAVIACALAGAVIVRFRPWGMARAMTVTAVGQALVGVVATVVGRDQPPGAAGLVVLNGCLVALFAGSAWLFARAARRAA